jgi:hypothetical protein
MNNHHDADELRDHPNAEIGGVQMTHVNVYDPQRNLRRYLENGRVLDLSCQERVSCRHAGRVPRALT